MRHGTHKAPTFEQRRQPSSGWAASLFCAARVIRFVRRRRGRPTPARVRRSKRPLPSEENGAPVPGRRALLLKLPWLMITPLRSLTEALLSGALNAPNAENGPAKAPGDDSKLARRRRRVAIPAVPFEGNHSHEVWSGLDAPEQAAPVCLHPGRARSPTRDICSPSARSGGLRRGLTSRLEYIE